MPPGDPPFVLPEQPFGIVSLHRFELINSRRQLTETLTLLAEAAKRTPLFFVSHSVTIPPIERFGLGRLFDAERFVRVPRLRFFDFLRLERRSSFVVTDSGGSQEECYYLDIPCLVHRVRTERREGLARMSSCRRCGWRCSRTFSATPRGSVAGVSFRLPPRPT